MGFFSNPKEQERLARLKAMEDKREAFAWMLDQQGFKPERMLFASTQNGGFTAFCSFDGRQWLILSPGFDTDEDFVIESTPRFDVRVEPVEVTGEGMCGVLGIGQKAERGVEYVITRADGSEARFSFVGGRTSWAEFPYKKNPLLDTRRRRKDANVAWELQPIDITRVDGVLRLAKAYFGL